MRRRQTSSQTPSRGTTPSRNRSTRDSAKVLTACLTCRQRKVKCSGTNPCSYCSKRDLDCSFSEHGKRRAYSVARIEYLEARLASYEAETQALSPLARSGSTSVPLREGTPLITSGPARARRSPVGIGVAEKTTSELLALSPGSAIAADSTLSSSYTFGSRVQSLLDEPRPGQPQENALEDTDQLLQPPAQNMQAFSIPSLPPENEAFSLLETFVFYIGHTQNYIDAREVSDRIGLLYANKKDTTYTDSLWTMEIILVFAIARLFTGSFGDKTHRVDSFPGYSLFLFVRERLPPLGQLYAVGRVGVEVMALVAVYLQNIYHKEEAYVYISTALRLAVSHGYHRKASGSRFLQSEATHVNRLWWSIYHQERRLAAATGSPPGISDTAIEQPLPTDSIGFTAAAPMRTSIKLAQAYGQVMNVLYGSTPQAEDAFILNVQSIIRSLYDISDEIPMKLATETPKLEQSLSLRTSAALQLMFYQALLLTIRPVMLHIAQLILSGKPLQEGILYSSPIGKLCQTCTEAARRLLKVLMALKQNKSLALFGFFDFDGIFSVTFIMILAAILDSTCKDGQKIQPSPGLGEAMDLIQHVASYENRFAAQWLREIRKTWGKLCTRLKIPEPHRNPAQGAPFEIPTDELESNLQAAHSVNASAQAQTPRREDMNLRGNDGNADMNNTAEVSVPGSQSILSDFDIWGDINYLWTPLPETWQTLQNGQSATIPQSLYHNIYGNQQWALTGEDMGDFAELGRHVVSDHPS